MTAPPISTRDGSTMSNEEYFDSDADMDNASSDAYASSGDTSDYAETMGAAADGVDDGADETQPIPGGGPLLEEADDAKVFKAIHRGVESQKRLAKNRDERAKHLEAQRGGCQFSILEKSEDRSYYKQIFPPGTDDLPQPIPNKVDDLCNKIVSQLLVDPFLPNPKPDSDSDRSRGAADLTKKVLRANATPDNCNDAGTFRKVLNGNVTRGSMYTFSWIDPVGGGWRPKQIKAHPQATDPSNPLVGPKLGPDGQPITIQTAQGPQTITETTSDPILRYVTDEGEDGAPAQFTTNPSDAARQWMPKLKRAVLPPSQVRLFPRKATAFEASAVTLLMYEELGEAKARFKLLGQLAHDPNARVNGASLRDLVSWRPVTWKSIVPESLRDKVGGDEGSAGEITDHTYVFWYHHFCRVGPDYVDGAEIAVSGALAGIVLKRDTLREDVELDDGTTVPVLMLPPVSQFRSLDDGKGGDPNGEGAVDRFGGAIEIQAHLYISILEAIDKGLHPIPFIPATSPVSREDLQRRDGRPVEILVPEDKPTWEQPPVIPPFTPQILDKVEEGMNSAAGTNETSNGLDSSYSESGVAKQVAINQAKIGLADQYQGFVAGVCYMWTIEAGLVAARYTVPQLVQLAGQDAAFKQRYYTGADLVGISRIALEPGSGSMMGPAEKLNYLSSMKQNAFLEPETAGELARASMSDDLGLPPNVHEERIEREIGEFVDGPPAGWVENFQSNQQITRQYQTQVETATQHRVAVLTQQGIPPQQAQQQAQTDVQQQIPQPQTKPLFNPFGQQANDGEPGVAKIRAVKLSRFMDTVDYAKQPPEWRQLCDAEWQRCFHLGGGVTVDQQLQMQQMQLEAENNPNFAQFVRDTTQKVLAVASKDIATGIATLEGMGPKNTDVSAPIATPQDPAAQAQAQAQQAQLEAAGAAADRQHKAMEGAKDRAHEAQQAALDRTHDLNKARLTAQSKAQSDHTRAHAQMKQSLVQSVLQANQAPPPIGAGQPQPLAAKALPAAQPSASPMGLPQ